MENSIKSVIFSANDSEFWNDDENGYENSLNNFRKEIEKRAGQDNGHENEDYVHFFVYGSLMWKNDAYNPQETKKATFKGFHRDVLMSTVYRGTPDAPGLVLGLNPGGETEGVILKVHKDDMDKAFAQYIKQELSAENDVRHGEKQHGMYKMVYAPVTLENGRVINTISVITNPDSPKATFHKNFEKLNEENPDKDMEIHQKALMIVSGRRVADETTKSIGLKTEYDRSAEKAGNFRVEYKDGKDLKIDDNGRSLHYFLNTVKALRNFGIKDEYLEKLHSAVREVRSQYTAILQRENMGDKKTADIWRSKLLNSTGGFIGVSLENELRKPGSYVPRGFKENEEIRRLLVGDKSGLDIKQEGHVLISQKFKKESPSLTQQR